jgi:hypothetical protein
MIPHIQKLSKGSKVGRGFQIISDSKKNISTLKVVFEMIKRHFG